MRFRSNPSLLRISNANLFLSVFCCQASGQKCVFAKLNSLLLLFIFLHLSSALIKLCRYLTLIFVSLEWREQLWVCSHLLFINSALAPLPSTPEFKARMFMEKILGGHLSLVVF